MSPAAPAGWDAASWPASPTRATRSSRWTATPSRRTSCPPASCRTPPTSWRRGRRCASSGKQRPTPSSTLRRSPYRSARRKTSSSAPTPGSPTPSSVRRRNWASARSSRPAAPPCWATARPRAGCRTASRWTSETTPRPWNAYALSKLIAEQTVQMFAAAQGRRSATRPSGPAMSSRRRNGKARPPSRATPSANGWPIRHCPRPRCSTTWTPATWRTSWTCCWRRWTPSPTARPSSSGPRTPWPPHRLRS